MLEAELAAEQAHLDRAYARLEVLQQQATELGAHDLVDHAETPAAYLERDAREAHGRRRFASLRIDGGLCFGRIDRTTGETFHIGRVGVAEADLTPLVIDWRAPVAEAFYRATPGDPLGLVRRRHLLTRARRVVGIEDEPLDLDSAPTDTGDGAQPSLVLVGEAALLGALTARRSGRMRDIVATIQAEQDRIIRSPLNGVLVVQGGPGTGKTAVALHRAAYLLYRHRFPLEQQGVLVIGPNPLFLRYIERVLPSLGESRCRLSTIDAVCERGALVAEADRRVARVKGDVRMATVIEKAVAGRQRPLPRTEVLGIGAYRLKIGRGATTRIVDAARARPGTHNERRPFVERLVVRHLTRQYAAAVERARVAGLAPTALPDADVRAAVASAPATRRVVERIWPRLTPEQLVSDLYAHEPLLREATEGLLAEDELVLLRRDPGHPWTSADGPLLDEAMVHLGRAPLPPRKTKDQEYEGGEDPGALVDRVLADRIPLCPECQSELSWNAKTARWDCEFRDCGRSWAPEEVMSPEAADELRVLQERLYARIGSVDEVELDPQTYGHVVVDEAQELSAMQWRLLARRCPSLSMTIVGDLAQGSGPSSAAAWGDVFGALGADQAKAGVVELTVNYRTPSEVMALADRLVEVRSGARCVRDAGVDPEVVELEHAEIVAALPGLVDRELEEVAGGKVAVILPDALVAGARDALGARAGTALDSDVTVLSAEDAKGLEFDSVVVVEPGSFEAGALYVALTRTTTRLVLAHCEPLPAALATSGSVR